MLRVWNVTLVITTFLLTIFGTFMTRSGVVQSVHAFGEDRALAWMFTAFMIAIVTVSFGFVIYRLPLLRARHELDSWASREAAFLVNNWILLFAALFVAGALEVLQGAVFHPDLAGLRGHAAIGGQVLPGDGQEETVDVAHDELLGGKAVRRYGGTAVRTDQST